MQEYADMQAEDVAVLLHDRFPNPSILEIGANDGEDTARMLRVMPTSTVVAFEPDPRALVRLRAALGSNPRVRIEGKAVGNINGSVPWFASNIDDLPNGLVWDKSSSLRTPTDHIKVSPEIYFTQDYTVECVRLDDVDLPPFDFAWIDVQGSQRDVIAGGYATLSRIPYIYIECHNYPLYEGEPRPEELFAMFPDHRPTGKWGQNYLFEKG